MTGLQPTNGINSSHMPLNLESSPKKERPTPGAIISIDCGSSMSSIAHVRIPNIELYDREGFQLPISNIKSQENYLNGSTARRVNEIPSVLAYNRETGAVYFGLDVKTALRRGLIQEKDQLKLLKLLIPQKSTIPNKIQKELRKKISKVRRLDPRTGQRATAGPKLVELYADILAQTWKNGLYDLHDRYTKAMVDSWNLRLVLCIPAIWRVMEIGFMREAALLAGLPEPEFVAEPEGAGALFFAESDQLIEENDAFVLCDAGGATVDLISYIPSQVSPTLKIKELVSGSGSFCGSFNLNLGLRNALPELLSDVLDDILEDTGMEETELYDLIENQFEEEKKHFNGFESPGFSDGNMYMDIHGLKRREARNVILNRNQLVLIRETVTAIFDPTVRKVRDLVQDQVTRGQEELRRLAHQRGSAQPEMRIKYIVLVGGFGNSPHLKDFLNQYFFTNKSAGYAIHVVSPLNPATAISRGGICCTTNKSFISERRARISIGFVRHEVYDSAIHKRCNPKKDLHDNVEYAYNRVHFLLRANEPVPRRGFVRKFYSRRTLSIQDEDFDFIQGLYGAETDVPDGISFKSKLGRVSVFQLGKIVANLSELPNWESFELRPAKGGDGTEMCYEFDYGLCISVVESTMFYEIIVPPFGRLPEEGEGLPKPEEWDDSAWWRRTAKLDISRLLK